MFQNRNLVSQGRRRIPAGNLQVSLSMWFHRLTLRCPVHWASTRPRCLYSLHFRTLGKKSDTFPSPALVSKFLSRELRQDRPRLVVLSDWRRGGLLVAAWSAGPRPPAHTRYIPEAKGGGGEGGHRERDPDCHSVIMFQYKASPPHPPPFPIVSL